MIDLISGILWRKSSPSSFLMRGYKFSLLVGLYFWLLEGQLSLIITSKYFACLIHGVRCKCIVISSSESWLRSPLITIDSLLSELILDFTHLLVNLLVCVWDPLSPVQWWILGYAIAVPSVHSAVIVWYIRESEVVMSAVYKDYSCSKKNARWCIHASVL